MTKKMGILFHMEYEGVFMAELSGDNNTVTFMEANECLNEVTLNRDELGKLIDELKAVHDKMND